MYGKDILDFLQGCTKKYNRNQTSVPMSISMLALMSENYLVIFPQGSEILERKNYVTLLPHSWLGLSLYKIPLDVESEPEFQVYVIYWESELKKKK